MDSADALSAALRDGGAMTRRDLVAATGLSLATVNRVLARLMAAGSVTVTGNETSSGGRPPELFTYNGEGQVVAGISVTNDGATALLSSLTGEVAARYEVPFARGDDPEARLKHTLALLDQVVAHPEGNLGGIGVAVPGVVSGPAGTVTAIPELGWDRLDLGDLLSRHAGRHVTLANDADCLAVAEHRVGAGRGVSDMVALVVRDGLGAGLITNGQLYQGFHHEAGEIGYLMTGRASLRRLFPDRGELEQLLGSQRLRAEAARLGVDESSATLPELIRIGRRADGPAGALADELLDLVALAVAAMCVVLDPELVIIGGTRADDMTPLIAGIRERLLGRILRVPRMVPAALGADAIMVGAAMTAVGR